MCQTAINLIEKEGRSPKAVMTQIRALRKKSGFLKSDQKVLRKMLSKKLLRGKKESNTEEQRGGGYNYSYAERGSQVSYCSSMRPQPLRPPGKLSQTHHLHFSPLISLAPLIW